MSTVTVDPDIEHTLELSETGLIGEVEATDKAIAAAQARRVRALAAVHSFVLAQADRRISTDTELRVRSAAAEVAARSQMHGRTIVRDMDEAWCFVENLPATVDALERGDITLAHARVVRTECLNLDGAERAAFETIALDRAQRESPARLREILRAVSEEFTTTSSFNERHCAARKERKVYVVDHDDGMSDLVAYLPSHIVHGIVDGLTNLAGSVKMANKRAHKRLSEREAQAELDGFSPQERDGTDRDLDSERVAATDTRSLDQIRADALCDLLLSCTPAVHGDVEDALHAVVHITIPALALLSQSDSPANLAGSGPIDIDTAKRLAGAAGTWERLTTSPIAGQILAVDTYRPSQHQRRLLRARDERCRFQGCRAKPWHGDLDHSQDYAFGGTTSNDNLAHLCRYHHTMKHATGWKLRQLEHGLIEWTDPSGRTYIDVPPHVARFIPSDELPPGARRPRTQRDLTTWTEAPTRRTDATGPADDRFDEPHTRAEDVPF